MVQSANLSRVAGEGDQPKAGGGGGPHPLAPARSKPHIKAMDTSPAAIWSRLASFPLGYFTATYAGHRYGVTRSVHANGRSMKLFAEQLGGSDVISLNIYAPPSGEPALKPCEMPLDKVTAFILGANLEAG